MVSTHVQVENGGVLQFSGGNFVLIEQLVLDEIIRLHQVLVCPIIFILHLVPNRMSWLVTSPYKSN